MSASSQQTVERVPMSADCLGEGGYIVVVVGLLEGADDADARTTRFTVEPDQFTVMCPT